MRPLSSTFLVPAALCVLVAASDAGAEEDPSIRVVMESTEVEFGVAFPLTVVREYDVGMLPAAWIDGALAPLVLRPVYTMSRKVDGRIEETMRFDAHAFRRGTVRVSPVTLTVAPEAGGAALTARSAEMRLSVRPSLDSKAPGDPEPPPEAPPIPRPAIAVWRMVLAAAAVLAASVVAARVVSRRRRVLPPPAPAAPPAPTVDPARRARERLAALLAAEDGGAATISAGVQVMREFLDARCAVSTTERTSEEILASVGRALGSAGTERLRPLLATADMVKFARVEPDSGERARWCAEADAFIESVGVAPASSPSPPEDRP